MCKLVVVLGHKFPSLLLNQWRSRQVRPKDCGSHNGSSRPVVFWRHDKSGPVSTASRVYRAAPVYLPDIHVDRMHRKNLCSRRGGESRIAATAPSRSVCSAGITRTGYCSNSCRIDALSGNALIKRPVCRAERIACRCTQLGAISATLPPATGEVGLDVQQFCLPTMGSMQAIPAKSLIPRNRY